MTIHLRSFLLRSLFIMLLLSFATGCGENNAENANNNAANGGGAETAGENDAAPTATTAAAGATATAMPEPAGDPTTTPAPTATATATAPGAPTGALIGVTMNSRVGVLLDELPVVIRDRVADALLEKPAAYWQALAARQINLSHNRLSFRDYFYDDKGQLPLPLEDLWTIDLDPDGPQRAEIQGHDLVVIDYTFSTTILTDLASPGISEPNLEEVGGVWEEPFIFPADPNLLLQRTGQACINEGGFPPNSFDSENVDRFYDYTCTANSGGPAGCHRLVLANYDCRSALTFFVGEVETNMRFERLEWDSTLADAVRRGDPDGPDAADLMVFAPDLANNRISYRYFGPDSCAIVENAVGGTGWRRLLQFNATVYNIGQQALHIGPVVAEDLTNNVFVYNACHDHFHYSNYGQFAIEGAGLNNGSKQAFCVQSTSRFSNNESSPLIHDYSCSFQGIQAGWVDEYEAGLDAQWVDITDLDFTDAFANATLSFSSNEDQFLCEGNPVLDEFGDILWEPTGFTTAEGASINRPQCDFVEDWDVNNRGALALTIPETGGFVTAGCANGEIGPLRNCGFTEYEALQSCTPGRSVTLTATLPAGAPPQVLRVCEASSVLGSGTACTASTALIFGTVGAESIPFNFTCPAARSEDEPGGLFALYSAPAFPDDEWIAVEIE